VLTFSLQLDIIMKLSQKQRIKSMKN